MLEAMALVSFAFPLAVIFYVSGWFDSAMDHVRFSLVYGTITCIAAMILGFVSLDLAGGILSGVGAFIGTLTLYWIGYLIGWLNKVTK